MYARVLVAVQRAIKWEYGIRQRGLTLSVPDTIAEGDKAIGGRVVVRVR